mmetsp:Transcript_147857/g.457217  ORF Transcript_147857/g.457217 Transcript_147857/m.457217 type:complete len:104 (-) Transcript_147857:103-414(-)
MAMAMVLSAKTAFVAASLLLLGATLQGCGCDQERAVECSTRIADSGDPTRTASSFCSSTNEMTKCLDDAGCCDHEPEDGMSHKKIVEAMIGTDYGGCKIERCR